MIMLTWHMRIKKGLTLTELSKKTGISVNSLDEYENLTRYPRIDKLERIAKALNCRITDLFESEYK